MSNADNTNLKRAKVAKDDEFYTMFPDIQKEINKYIDYDENVFRDKTILLPCDDPEWSNFTRFFAQNFERFGIKKLISTSYAIESKGLDLQPTLFETQDPRFDIDKTKIKGKKFILDRDTNKNGKIDIEDLTWEYMDGDGDFRSNEVKKLRDESDIIITNPPFSLFKDFISWIYETDKKFLIIGNLNAVIYSEVFPRIKNNKMWLGCNNVKEFQRADKTIEKFGNVVWYTNIEHGIRHKKLECMTIDDNIKFSKHKEIKGKGYVRYENFDGIDVGFIDAIPSDFKGVMGVPKSFLQIYNPEQFEILGLDNKTYCDELGIKRIGEDWVRRYKENGGTGHITANMKNLVMTVDGKAKMSFARILIKYK